MTTGREDDMHDKACPSSFFLPTLND